jgi:hypothetical protein
MTFISFEHIGQCRNCAARAHASSTLCTRRRFENVNDNGYEHKNETSLSSGTQEQSSNDGMNRNVADDETLRRMEQTPQQTTTTTTVATGPAPTPPPTLVPNEIDDPPLNIEQMELQLKRFVKQVAPFLIGVELFLLVLLPSWYWSGYRLALSASLLDTRLWQTLGDLVQHLLRGDIDVLFRTLPHWREPFYRSMRELMQSRTLPTALIAILKVFATCAWLFISDL